MIKADSRDLSYTNLSSNSIYIFSRFIYEKKWASYLRLGITEIDSDQLTSNGSYIAFGVDYKLNKKWYIESGYHISIIDDKSYNKIEIIKKMLTDGIDAGKFSELFVTLKRITK